MFITNHPVWVVTRVSTLTLAMVVLTQCSDKPRPSASADHYNNFRENTVHDSYNTATTPLKDLGVTEDDIAEVLKANMDAPYAHAPKFNCQAALLEIAQIDAALGPDVDAPRTGLKANAGFAVDEDTILDRGADLAHDSVVGFVRAQTNILPFRSVIRQITGAKHHEKEMARAEMAGRLRRAYLKGMLQANGKCPAPHIPPGPHIEEARSTLIPGIF